MPGQRFAIAKLADVLRDHQQGVQVACNPPSLNKILGDGFGLEIQRVLLPKHSLRSVYFGVIVQLRPARLGLGFLLLFVQQEREDRAAQRNLIAVVQHLLADGNPIHNRSMPASQIANYELSVIAGDHAVLPRQNRIGNADVVR